MSVPIVVWAATIAVIAGLLAADMLAHRWARDSGFRAALAWSAVWVALGTGFGGVIWAAWGGQRAGEYFAGYLLEKSLSVDNILVFALIFSAFAVPRRYQHRVLFLGVIGALVMRAALIGAGSALLSRFEWVLYVFGAFLVVTAWRMLRTRRERAAPPGGRLVRQLIRADTGYHGDRFWIRRAGRLAATPLLMVLITVEASDLVFAADSIPAVFSVTREPFLLFTSNAFAVLGLRALYFALSGLMDRLIYLKTGLAVILAFVGLKMLLSDLVHLPAGVSLGVIAACLAVTAWLSLRASAAEPGNGTGSSSRPPGREQRFTDAAGGTYGR